MKRTYMIAIVGTLLLMVNDAIAQTAEQQERIELLKEERAKFQACVGQISQTHEGRVVYGQILIMPGADVSESTALMTSTATLNSVQLAAVVKTYDDYRKCRAPLIASLKGTPFAAPANHAFKQIDVIVAKLINGKATIGETNVAMAQIREKTQSEVSGLL